MLCGGMIRNAVCFKTAKIMKTNANIIGEPRIKNDEGVVAYLKRKQLNMLKYTYVSIVSRILLKRNIVEVLSQTRKWLLIWPWGPNVVVFCQQFVMALSFPSRDICTIVMWAKQTKEILLLTVNHNFENLVCDHWSLEN